MTNFKIQQLQDAIMSYTASCGWYHGLPNHLFLRHIFKTPEELVEEVVGGLPEGNKDRNLHYQHRHAQRDLVERFVRSINLSASNEGDLSTAKVMQTPLFFKEWGYKIVAEPHFKADDIYGLCLWVKSKAEIPDYWKIEPRSLYLEAQAIMLYTETNSFMFVYETRDTGLVRIRMVDYNPNVADKIIERVNEVLDKVKKQGK